MRRLKRGILRANGLLRPASVVGGSVLLLSGGSALAATTTNDILDIANYASDGFEAGFAIGVPILILLILLGWILLGLRTGIKGRR